MELNNNKKEIIETTKSKVLVNASSGSGKTSVLTERAKYLLQQGEENIVILTFTNAAAAEMRHRIENSGINLKNTFIGTIHSYANYLLLCSGYSTHQLIENEQFDELFERIKENLYCIQSVNHLLLDEAQDSTKQQFEFILDIVKPKNYFIVYDLRQSIYGFNDAHPETLIDLMRKDDVTVYSLNINYRSAENILTFAKGIINRLGFNFYDDSIPAHKGGQVFKMEFTPENVINVIKNDKESNYKDWFILLRTNKELEYIYEQLTAADIPCDTFKKSELDNNSLEEKLKENTVKVLTTHSAKGLESKNVIVGSFPMKNAEEIRVGYVAATRAKEKLYWFQPKKKRTSSKKKNIVNWD